MPTGHKDPGTVAAEIKMTRMMHDGALLVVEGIDDSRFWRTRRHSTCEVLVGEGKQNVVRGIGCLSPPDCRGVWGVVDDDYDSLLGVERRRENIAITDAHDLECLMCRSRALETVLVEHGSPEKIKRFVGKEGVEVRTALTERAAIFGRTRLAAALHGLDIEHAAISLERFLSRKTWEVDSAGLLRAVVKEGSMHDESVVKSCLDRLPVANVWWVVQGHDLLEVLRIGLMGALGNMKPSVGSGQLAQLLRAAMSREDLQDTQLWAEIRNWEECARGQYLVLAE